MPQPLVECVPNISEGRNLARVQAVVDALAQVPGTVLLHTTADADHNRSVITFAGSPGSVEEAALRAVAKAAELIDLNRHLGVHPRLGALDVLPFVPIAGCDLKDCVALAHAVGKRIWSELAIPVYFYEAASRSRSRMRLEDVRRGQFEAIRELVVTDPERRPDIGGPGLHPSAGAVIVGARKFLIAYNINLDSADLQLAKEIAAAIRERDGGLPGVKALGLPLQSRGMVQVSMNITDYERTPLRTVYAAVEHLAAVRGVAVVESELIGLAPRSALTAADIPRLKLREFDESRFVESRIAAAGL